MARRTSPASKVGFSWSSDPLCNISAHMLMRGIVTARTAACIDLNVSSVILGNLLPRKSTKTSSANGRVTAGMEGCGCSLASFLITLLRHLSDWSFWYAPLGSMVTGRKSCTPPWLPAFRMSTRDCSLEVDARLPVSDLWVGLVSCRKYELERWYENLPTSLCIQSCCTDLRHCCAWCTSYRITPVKVQSCSGHWQSHPVGNIRESHGSCHGPAI